MRLFDDKPRNHVAPKGNGEHPFTYTDRSSRLAAANVRDFLERAFSHYPAERQAELVARLRSDGYRAGSFELILHELLRLRGIPFEVEAPKDGTAKRPDYLVGPDGHSFYLEAVLATDESPERVAEHKRLGDLVDIVNRTPSDNFFVGFQIETWGPGQPSAKSITEYLTIKLRALDPDDDSIWIGPQGPQSPEWVWEHQGWRIVFRPMPKKESARGASGRRVVGMISEGLRAMSTAEAIRGAIGRKATRYGAMDRPYVIAVNVLRWPLDDIDCIEALYGTVEAVEHSGDGVMHMVRKRDGVLGPEQNTRVSAVAFFEDVDPWNAGTRKAVIVHNRFAKRPLPFGTLGLPDARYLGGDVLKRDGGKSLGELVRLPTDWPSE
jgi:hypothetical protein